VLPGLYGESDPSIAIGPKNTIYEGFANGDGHAEIAVSRDHAQTWSTPVDVGKAFGIQNTEFAEVTAGDDDRAAFAFLGSPTPGDSQSAFFGCTPDKDANGNPVDCPGGRWDLYVSVTYDGGKTWTTTDATPNDPVQRTCIWNGGGTNTCRNLLDFMDITVDRAGRVLVGYPDGCTGACVTSTKWKDNPFSALATIARQNCGRTLYSAYDGKLPACGPVAAARVVPSGSVKSAQRRALPNTSPVTSSALLVLVLAALPLPGALMGLAARRTRR
jgi:hypothetical protein